MTGSKKYTVAKKLATVASLIMVTISIFTLSGCTSSEIDEYKSNSSVQYFLGEGWIEDADVLIHYEYLSDLSDQEAARKYLDASHNVTEQATNLNGIAVDENSDQGVIELHMKLLEGSEALVNASTGFMNASMGLADGQYDDSSAEYMAKILEAQDDMSKAIGVLTDLQE